jgi:hypothetical protein
MNMSNQMASQGNTNPALQENLQQQQPASAVAPTYSHVAQICYEIPILKDTEGFTHCHFYMKLAL